MPLLLLLLLFFPLKVLHSPRVLETMWRITAILELLSLIPTEILKCAPKSLSIILLSADGKALEKVVSLKWLIGNNRNMAANLTVLLLLLLLLLLCLKTQLIRQVSTQQASEATLLSGQKSQ